MKRVVVDTNVLVSFLTDRNPEQQALARELLGGAVAGEIELILHQTVLTELVYVLGNLYDLDSSEISGILRDLLASPGIRPFDEVVWLQVVDSWPETYRDFSDAILASATSDNRFDSIATFDQRFARALVRQGLNPYWAEPREAQ